MRLRQSSDSEVLQAVLMLHECGSSRLMKRSALGWEGHFALTQGILGHEAQMLG